MGFLPSEPGIEDGLCISESTARNFAMYGYGTAEELAQAQPKAMINQFSELLDYVEEVAAQKKVS
jgi:uncharacterized protein YqiB (DUF1249 family)